MNSNILLIAALFVVTTAISLVAVAIILVRLPADYFHNPVHRVGPGGHPVRRWTLIILKNVAGWAIIALGLALSLPGIPGQGLLTIFIGLMLVDIPGKYKLERAILGRPSILGAINRLRARFGRPPMEVG